jgi:hypothetical protein
MRLPTELWVKAYLRQLSSAGLFATVACHGDDDLGAVFVKVNRLDGTAVLLGPAPESLDGSLDGSQDRALAASGRRFVVMHKGETLPEADAERQLAQARSFDSDVWVIEVEDRQGRHGLEDVLAKD